VVVDTSALVALLLGEPGAEDVAAAFETAAGPAVISAATLVEATIVVEARLGADGVLRLDQLLRLAEVATVAVDAVQAAVASDAWRAFGKSRHPAALNLGDCFTYALARCRDEPVLCVGNDFRRTDIETVP
jgi:ribonuclease VapC